MRHIIRCRIVTQFFRDDECVREPFEDRGIEIEELGLEFRVRERDLREVIFSRGVSRDDRGYMLQLLERGFEGGEIGG